jgi:peptidoglycan hydrolase CwlO-like protein
MRAGVEQTRKDNERKSEELAKERQELDARWRQLKEEKGHLKNTVATVRELKDKLAEQRKVN